MFVSSNKEPNFTKVITIWRRKFYVPCTNRIVITSLKHFDSIRDQIETSNTCVIKYYKWWGFEQILYVRRLQIYFKQSNNIFINIYVQYWEWRRGWSVCVLYSILGVFIVYLWNDVPNLKCLFQSLIVYMSFYRNNRTVNNDNKLYFICVSSLSIKRLRTW